MPFHHLDIFIVQELHHRLCCVTRSTVLNKWALALEISVYENESHVPEADSSKLQTLL